MNRRWLGIVLTIILWILIAVGGVVINRTINQTLAPQSYAWLAAKELTANHKITAEDIKRPGNIFAAMQLPASDEYIGKHLLTAKSIDDKILAEDLTDFPSIELADPDHFVFVYPLVDDEIPLVNVIDVDDTVNLCAAYSIEPEENSTSELPDKQIICLDESLVVHAVFVGAEDSTSSWLALKISQNEIAPLGQFLSAEDKFLLIGN